MRKFSSYRVLCSCVLVLLSVLGYSLHAQDVQIVQENDLFGLKIDAKVVLQPKYQKVEALGKDYYTFTLNDKVGLYYLPKKAVVAEPIYAEVTDWENKTNYISVAKEGKEGLFLDGEVFLPCAYDSIFSYRAGWEIWQKGKVGYYVNKTQATPCVYENLALYDWYSEHNNRGSLTMIEAVVAKNANGSIDIYRGSDAKLILKGNLAVFDDVSSKGSLLVLHKGNKVGFVTRAGKVIAPTHDKLIARGNDTFAFLNQINYNQGVLYVYNSAGNLLGKHNVDASRPMSLRRTLGNYNLVLSL